ncbi:MAG: M48 family metalloprotease [Thalassovita sp.]|nr:M48 family metalloprotease [Thalassovita sp.]
MRLILILAAASGLSGCLMVPPEPAGPAPSQQVAAMFVSVARAVEPVAEAECRQHAPQLNCDFRIVVDRTDAGEANAHQFLSRAGRPILSFNYALINGVRNADELAFVMGHEAGHHIAGHLARQEVNARQGAQVLAQMASSNGASAEEIREARQLGAALGALQYSQEFELEADHLGAIISIRAGYNPVIGARYFLRLPGAGDGMLGTHPPNDARIEGVRRAAREFVAPQAGSGS